MGIICGNGLEQRIALRNADGQWDFDGTICGSFWANMKLQMGSWALMWGNMVRRGQGAGNCEEGVDMDGDGKWKVSGGAQRVCLNRPKQPALCGSRQNSFCKICSLEPLFFNKIWYFLFFWFCYSFNLPLILYNNEYSSQMHLSKYASIYQNPYCLLYFPVTEHSRTKFYNQ